MHYSTRLAVLQHGMPYLDQINIHSITPHASVVMGGSLYHVHLSGGGGVGNPASPSPPDHRIPNALKRGINGPIRRAVNEGYSNHVSQGYLSYTLMCSSQAKKSRCHTGDAESAVK